MAKLSLARRRPAAPTKVGARVTVTDDGAHNAFGGCVLLANGTLLAVYRKGVAHEGADGNLVKKTSADGVTWSAESTVLDPATDVRDPALVQLADGAVVCSYTDMVPWGLAKSIRSTDNGVTWGSPVTIDAGFTLGTACSAPPIELANGDLLQACHGANVGQDTTWGWAAVSKSTDKALTWEPYSVIHPYDPVGPTDYWEPNLLLFDNDDRMLAVTWSFASDLQRIYESADDGMTWSHTGQITRCTGRPALFQTPHGEVLVLVRNNARNGDPTALGSWDGATWQDPTAIDSGNYVYGQWTPTGVFYSLQPDLSTASCYWQRMEYQ